MGEGLPCSCRLPFELLTEAKSATRSKPRNTDYLRARSTLPNGILVTRQHVSPCQLSQTRRVIWGRKFLSSYAMNLAVLAQALTETGSNRSTPLTIEPADKAQAEAAEERLIREKAYQLWQADGAPEGKAEHYWHLARKLISQGEKNEQRKTD